MSITHFSFGRFALKSCSSTFFATGRAWFESVVCRNFRTPAARNPCRRISRATVFSHTRTPRERNSRHIRGLP
jgi:hypothetical protein